MDRVEVQFGVSKSDLLQVLQSPTKRVPVAVCVDMPLRVQTLPIRAILVEHVYANVDAPLGEKCSPTRLNPHTEMVFLCEEAD